MVKDYLHILPIAILVIVGVLSPFFFPVAFAVTIAFIASLFFPPTAIVTGGLLDVLYFSGQGLPYWTLLGILGAVIAAFVHEFVKTRIIS